MELIVYPTTRPTASSNLRGRQRGPPRPPKGAVMLTTLQSENLQITRPSAPKPVSARGSGIAKTAPMSLCSQKFPKRCGIGRRYGCVDAEQPCGSRDSVSAQCNRSAVGPSRRDRGALKRCGRLELVHPAHDMPCASLQFENLQITTPRGDVWPKKAHIGPRALCCCAARPGRAVPKSWLRGPLAALREGRPPPGARSALV